MLYEVKKLLLTRRIKDLLEKNQITILHYIPGRVRLCSPLWKQHPEIITRLIFECKNENRIRSVTYSNETGSLLVKFDATPVTDLYQIEMWIETLGSILNGNK
ncbi:HMA2 domain-containing protein [Pontibacillus sp. HMF3514]|uniref:HMA2 domain-containing protein n=1 Tax=Pontibacillus sp. HMF3514 TaxID=2692425 RepID=UPI00131FA51D|nr:hypothetical protein [Pontibacillus sp. HMF3514]QHE51552.1 hypothetical protein GS400_05665 [Pontibacillus sp. HMF3514]